MADENIKWASLGGLKQATPARLRQYGYTTSTGTSSGTPEYPILEYDNFWRSSISSVANSNLDRLDNLAAADVYYQFVIESGSNIVLNNPFDTFTTRYGTASSNAGTTSLATQVTASDFAGAYAKSTQYCVSGDFRRFLEKNTMYFFQGAKIDGDTTPKYMYGLNDVGGLNYFDSEYLQYGIPIHRYDNVIGDYVLDHRVGGVELLPTFAAESARLKTPFFNLMQHDDILYVLFGNIPAFGTGTSQLEFELVKYDMESRSVLASTTLIHSTPNSNIVDNSSGTFPSRSTASGYMDISPDGSKMAIVAPSNIKNNGQPAVSFGLKAQFAETIAFIVDLDDDNLNYSDISDVKDWASSGTLRDSYRRIYVFDVLKWEDNNTLNLLSYFNKVTNIHGVPNGTSSSLGLYSGYSYIQHQKIDVSGLTATNNTTTDLTNLIIGSSTTLSATSDLDSTFAADFNFDLGELCIKVQADGSVHVLNRFDLSSLSLLATNENTPNVITNYQKDFYYNKNGKIIFPVADYFSNYNGKAHAVYLDEQFTSVTSVSTIEASDLPVTMAISGNNSSEFAGIVIYPTHTRLLAVNKPTFQYTTDTLRSGGNYLNATSNVQYFDDLSIAAVFANIPLANSILPHIKKVKYNPSTGSLTNVKSFVLAFDTTQATGGSQDISIVANSSTYNITGTGADWPTLLSDLADNLFAQGNFVNNAVVMDNKAIYVTLSYPKNATTVMDIDQNVSLSSGNCTIGTFEISSIDSSLIEDTEAAYLYLVDYTSMSATMSTSFTDITFKQYDTYVTSITNVQQALDSLFKIVQDLEDFDPASSLAINVGNATRFVSLNLALTANTPVNLNHALGEKYVVATVYSDSTDESLQSTIVLVDDNNCTVEVGLTGTYNVVIVK